jgi:hypothetical protein
MSNDSFTKLKDAPTLRYLDPEQVRVFRNPELNNRVCALVNNEVMLIDPRFLRVNPLSDPDLYISIREADPGKGKEHGLLRNWQRLDPESRALVEEGLERRYLTPVLLSIESAKDYGGVTVCMFETDRGMREVTLRDVRDNVVYLPDGRLLLTDAEGNRYDLPDINALDPRSAQILALIL